MQPLQREKLFTNHELLTLLWPLIIEQTLSVLVAIEPGMSGRVRVDGLDWQARAEVAIPQGARICVADVDGAVLLVTPVTEATSVE